MIVNYKQIALKITIELFKHYFCISSSRDDKVIGSLRDKFCTKYVRAVPSLNRMQKLPTRVAPYIYLHNMEVLTIFYVAIHL